VLDLGSQLFALKRWTPERDRFLFAITNITGRPRELALLVESEQVRWIELLSGVEHESQSGKLCISLPPYGSVWLKPAE